MKDMPPEYYTWFQEQTFQTIDTAVVRDMIMEQLTHFNQMTTEEYILWQKWEEIQLTYPMHNNTLFGDWAYYDKEDARIVTQVKSLLWNEPSHKYIDIEPELIRTGDTRYENISDHWSALRILIHSQQHSGSIGRGINYLVRDRGTGKYLGVVAIASDFLDLAGRDAYIGWTREQRTQEQRIKHTAVCSTIVPVQPFGYNLVGGKLLSLLCLSNQVTDDWKKIYGDTLVGMTTTSLYGKNKGGHGMSQYDNLKYWKRMGYTSGSSALRIKANTKDFIYAWAKTHMPQDYYMFLVHKDENGMSVRDRLNRFYQKIYRHLKIPQKLFTSDHDRGIYFAPLYHNTKEFLRNEIAESQLVPIPNMSVNDLTILWKTKYAFNRYIKLRDSHELKSEPLFYDDMAQLTWEEAKEKYLKHIGR